MRAFLPEVLTILYLRNTWTKVSNDRLSRLLTYDYEFDALNHERDADTEAHDSDEDSVSQRNVEAILWSAGVDLVGASDGSADPEAINEHEGHEDGVHDTVRDQIADECLLDQDSRTASSHDWLLDQHLIPQEQYDRVQREEHERWQLEKEILNYELFGQQLRREGEVDATN